MCVRVCVGGGGGSFGTLTASCLPRLPLHPPPPLAPPQALFGTLTPDVVVLTILYSIAGLGIAIVNDFKSIEGEWRGREGEREGERCVCDYGGGPVWAGAACARTSCSPPPSNPPPPPPPQATARWACSRCLWRLVWRRQSGSASHPSTSRRRARHAAHAALAPGPSRGLPPARSPRAPRCLPAGPPHPTPPFPRPPLTHARWPARRTHTHAPRVPTHPHAAPHAHPTHPTHPPTPMQLGIAAYLALGLDEPVYAGVLLLLVLPQASSPPHRLPPPPAPAPAPRLLVLAPLAAPSHPHPPLTHTHTHT